jgi:K+-sensing histidine kinase KdpD
MSDISDIPVAHPKDALDRVRDELNAERFLADKLTRELAAANRLASRLRAQNAVLQIKVRDLTRRLDDAERGQRFRRLAQELEGALSLEDWEAIKKQID